MERVSIREAAEILNCSEQFVRIGLQRGVLPIGTAVKMTGRYSYVIPRERLNAYLEGRDIKNAASGN